MTLLELINQEHEKIKIEKEKNTTVEFKFVNNMEEMEINKLVGEIISHLYLLKDKYRKYQTFNIKDIRMIDEETRGDILFHIDKEEKGSAYDRATSIITKKIDNLFSKKGLYLSDEEIDKYKFQFTEDALYEVILQYVNGKIDKVNDDINYLSSLLKNDLKVMKQVQKLLNNPQIDIEQIISLVSASYLEQDVKDIVIKQAKIYYEQKELEKRQQQEKLRLEEAEKLKKVELDSSDTDEIEEYEEPKLFQINNYGYVKDIIEKYEELFPSSLIGMDIEEVFNIDDLRQVIGFSFNDIDDEMFSSCFVTILAMIDKKDNLSDDDILLDYLKILCNKYEVYNRLLDIIQQIKNVSLLPGLSEEEITVMYTFKQRIEHLKKYEDLDNVLSIIENMKITLYSIISGNKSRDLDNNKVSLKGFVLFDYREEEYKKPYILDDLDYNSGKSYIDTSIEKDKIISNGYIDFNVLIDDILNLGNAEICLQSSDKLSKLVRPVYYSDGYHKIKNTKMSNASGLYRIRPRISSYLRFFDEKELLIPNTKKFNQIKQLLESKLPGIVIDESKPFNLFINYMDAFKKKDTDSYTTVKKRQSSSVIRKALKNDLDYYTDEELAIISDAIDISLDTYKKLENLNDNFNFDIVDKIKSEKRKRD